MSRDTEDEVGFSAQKWVWFPDEEQCFLKGTIVEEEGKGEGTNDDDSLVKVQNEFTSTIFEIQRDQLQKVNPPKFDKCDDMASLTFLNEPSVLNNLSQRYQDDLIYTYSGLFLVAINPYKELNIYNKDFVKMYHHTNSGDNDESESPPVRPHIFAITEKAYQNLIQDRQDQSILVTGESGAGKTENTKKIIQYLTSITITNGGSVGKSDTEDFNFEQKILEANPILEAFGNSQTSRNNNSSRFGKFIKLRFDTVSKKLVGVHIDWYLLEKSRVVHQDSNERNYHVFYQLLQGLSDHELSALHLEKSISLYNYLKNGNATIPGVDDKKEFKDLVHALKTVDFGMKEIASMFKVLALILLLGNLEFANANSDKQAVFSDESPIQQVCQLLEINDQHAFTSSILKPKVKAGKEFVSQQKNPKQAKFAIDALSKSLYEKLFEFVVSKINQTFITKEDTNNSKNLNKFIGILDIAGFEIFQKNSFEQLCINYTNEKLQQFFNHHMFVLEQNEYLKENINWKFIDFGNDLIPTIDLIETKKKNQLGIFPLLDEECIVVNSSDKSLLEKLFHNLETKDKKQSSATSTTDRFRPNKNRSGFIVKHYAGEVEYDTDGWLDKNRDPLGDAIVEVLYQKSNNLFIKNFYKNEAEEISAMQNTKKKTRGTANKKSSMLRTVASRHKSQLTDLMTQLSETDPHFVRCIIPNNNKQQGQLDTQLVLNQLRCNGVLEGIRIARAGYPNRIAFAEFFDRYKIFCKNASVLSKSKSNAALKQNCELILESFALDPEVYKVGTSKLFFKNSVLAEIEKRREHKVEEIIVGFQAYARGMINRDNFKEKLLKLQASRLIAQNFNTYNDLKDDPWFNLFVKLKPMLSSQDGSSSSDMKMFKDKIKHLTSELVSLKKENNSIQKEQEKSSTQVKEINGALEKKEGLLQTKESELQKLKKHEIELERLLSTKVAELKEIQEQLSNMIEENKKLKTSLSDSSVDLKKGQKAVDSLENEKTNLTTKIETLTKELESTKLQHSKSTAESTTLNESIKMLKSTLKERESKIATLEQDIKTKTKDLELKLSTANNGYNQATSKLREAINEKDELQKELSKLKTSNNSVDSAIKQKEQQLKALSKSINSDQSKITSIETERNEIESKYHTVKQELVNANDELRRLSKKHQKLQHDLAQSKTLLDSKIEDDVRFSRGKQVHDRDILELKETIIELRDQLSSNNGNNSGLESQLRALKYENDQLLKMKKTFDIKIAELTFQLRNKRSVNLNLSGGDNDVVDDNDDQTDTSLLKQECSTLRLQLNESTANSTKITVENRHLKEELSLLQTRLASESYENRALKVELKKLMKPAENDENRDSFDYLTTRRPVSSISREATELKLQLETERRANKRIEALNISLQKELLQHKNHYRQSQQRFSNGYNLSGDEEEDSNSEDDVHDAKYKAKFMVAQEKIMALESQLKESASAPPLRDTTSSVVNHSSTALSPIPPSNTRSPSQTEKLRLNAKINELNAQLKRARITSDSSNHRREDHDNLRSKLEVLEQSNLDLSSSVQLYKSRADDYYGKLEAADIAIKAAKRSEEIAKREREELKKTHDYLQKESKVNDDKLVRLHSQIRDLEQNLSDVNFEKRKLEKQYQHLKEKYYADEELRSSTSSSVSASHERELNQLNMELKERINRETEMSKTIKYLSLELDNSKKQTSEYETQVYDLSRLRSKLEKELQLFEQQNDKLKIRQKEVDNKMDTLMSQVNALRSINEDLILERDSLLETKRTLESQLKSVNDEFDKYLAKTNEEVAKKVSLKELEQKLIKNDELRNQLEKTVDTLQSKHKKLAGEYNALKQDSITMIEENKALTKFNKKLVDKNKETESQFKKTLEEKEHSWQQRVISLESKIDQINSDKIDEDQKVYNLKKLSKDLKFKYEEQLYLVSRYRKENDELDNKLDSLAKELEMMRNKESKSSLQIKRTERKLEEYKETVLNLENELLNWKKIQSI